MKDDIFICTEADLKRDFIKLGVAPGMTLLVHSSLSKVGWIIGGAAAALRALMDCLGPQGTLVMPTFSMDVSDPAEWGAFIRIAPEKIEDVRAGIVPFDKSTTPSIVGRLPELFRTWPDVFRSDHPQASFAAWGHHAANITRTHPLDWPTGESGPLGRLSELDAHILLLGVSHDRNTALHYAETKSAQRRIVTRRYPCLIKGSIHDWRSFQDVADDNGALFPALGDAFERAEKVKTGLVGQATCKLFKQNTLEQFAVAWFDRELSTHGE